MAGESDAHHGTSEAAKLKEAWQNYGLAIIFIGVAPLLPIIIELSVSREVTEGPLFITAAMYSITVALASNNRFYMGFFLIASIIEAAIYGSITKETGAHPLTSNIVGIKVVSNDSSGLSDSRILFIAILIPFISLLVERFSRHIRKREEFFEFLKGREA